MKVLWCEPSKARSAGSLNLRCSLLSFIYMRSNEERSEGKKWISAEDRGRRFLSGVGGRMTLPGSPAGIVSTWPEISLNTG